MSKLAKAAAKVDAEAPKVASVRILKNEVDEAVQALNASTARLFISGLSAGLDLGFSLLFMAMVRTWTDGSPPALGSRLLTATMYSFGFVIVILGRSELFTEQTSLATLPWMTGEATLVRVARLWSIVWTANLVGAAMFAAIVTTVGPALHDVQPRVFAEIAREVIAFPWWVILLSAMIAGWLMGLLSWVVAAGRDTISQIVVIWLITTAIGFGHFHHAVVGSVEMFAGMFSDHSITWHDFGYFLLWTTLGNALGGPIFIMFKYGLARPRAKAEDV